jgi:CheY-like chemotaxis protein
MSDVIAKALIKIIPSIVWATVAAAALIVFHRSIRDDLLPRLLKLKAFGVEADFVKKTLDEASRTVPTGDELSRGALARRAERLASIIAGAKALLVNDVPEEMKFVIELLRSLKIELTIATSSREALDLLRRQDFDVVLSDMSRDGVPDEGIKFLRRSIEMGINRPTIFTVGNYDPNRGTPAHAFGITNKIDEVLHYVFDVIERRRS